MRKKDKLEFIVTLFLVIVFLFIILSRKGNKQKRAKPPLFEIKKDIQKADIDLEKVYFLAEVVPGLTIERDPFVFAPRPSVENNSVIGLEGIIWDEKDPKAVMDGEVVGVGDKVGEETILEIKRDKVILSDGVNTRDLRLR